MICLFKGPSPRKLGGGSLPGSPEIGDSRRVQVLLGAGSRSALCRCGSRSSSSTEGLFVSTDRRSFLLAVLLPACLLVGAFAVVRAQNVGSASRWSDPATWPNRKVPAAGDKVTIPEGKNVVLDV